MASSDIEAYIADLRNAIEEGRLALDRDRFNQIELPTYQNISLPTSIGQNTGFLPSGYVGGYGGRATWNALTGSADMFGQVGAGEVDPRLAALGYTSGQKTLAGRQLDLQGDDLRARYEHMDREFGASRSDADRTFAEMQRAQLQDQANQDRQFALEIGVDPSRVVGGQVIPDYLQPHAEWARNFASQNQGRLPGYADLVKALAPAGRVPEDYNPAGQGQPFAGQIPAAGPGVARGLNGNLIDVVSGQTLDQRSAADLIRNRQGAAVPMSLDANGQPVYRPGGGASPIGLAEDPNARQRLFSANGGEMMRGGPALTYGGALPPGTPPDQIRSALGSLPAYGGPGAPGSATAGIGQGQAMSLDQRRLIEQGRTADLQNALGRNAQRIQEEESLRQDAIARGQLDLARQHEQNAAGLDKERLGLEQEIQRGRLELDKGIQTGFVDGQETLGRINTFGQDASGRNTLETGRAIGNIGGQQTVEAGALTGVFNGQSTLAGQTAYGGSALVGNGLTLEAQQALGRVGGQATLGREQMENQTALQYMQQAADLSRNPADWVRYSTMLGGTPGGIRDIVDASAGRFNMARYGDYGTGSGGMASVGSVAAGAGNAAGEIQQAQNRLAAPNQLAPQQMQKMGATQRAMLGGLYESGNNAMRATDVEEMYRKALPKYGGPRAGRMVA